MRHIPQTMEVKRTAQPNKATLPLDTPTSQASPLRLLSAQSNSPTAIGYQIRPGRMHSGKTRVSNTITQVSSMVPLLCLLGPATRLLFHRLRPSPQFGILSRL